MVLEKRSEASTNKAWYFLLPKTCNTY